MTFRESPGSAILRLAMKIDFWSWGVSISSRFLPEAPERCLSIPTTWLQLLQDNSTWNKWVETWIFSSSNTLLLF